MHVPRSVFFVTIAGYLICDYKGNQLFTDCNVDERSCIWCHNGFYRSCLMVFLNAANAVCFVCFIRDRLKYILRQRFYSLEVMKKFVIPPELYYLVSTMLYSNITDKIVHLFRAYQCNSIERINALYFLYPTIPYKVMKLVGTKINLTIFVDVYLIRPGPVPWHSFEIRLLSSGYPSYIKLEEKKEGVIECTKNFYEFDTLIQYMNKIIIGSMYGEP